MKYILNRKTIDKILEVGVVIKSFFGFFEILTGIVFAISGKAIVSNLLLWLTQQEVSEDPHDSIANYIISVANNYSEGSYIFSILYLIFHGFVNIFLAIALLKNKIWAYPWALSGFSIFTIYQIYRYFHTYSPVLLLLTFFDIFIITIVWLEYRKYYNKKKILG